MSLSSRRMILPDLVFGRSVPNSTALGRAILPIRSPTHSRSSPASSSEGSLPARSSTKGWIPFERPGRLLEPFHELLGPPEPEALVVALSLLVDRGVLDDGLSCELGRGREGAPHALEQAIPRYARRNCLTGTISRPKVKLVTPANDAYQAASAVARPNHPPSLPTPVLPAASPIPRRKKVMARSRNTRFTAAVVRNEAIHMYAVKMPQPIRYRPTAEPTLAAGTPFAKKVTKAQ